MSRRTVLIIGAVALFVVVFALAAFIWLSRSQDRLPPTISITPDNGRAGTLITVAGGGWRAGQQVEILVAVPYSTPGQDSVLASARADARGDFTAYFAFPQDERWTGLAQVWVVARAAMGADQATAWFRLSRPTFTPEAMATPTPPEKEITALVQDVDQAANNISIISPDYFGDKVMLGDGAVILLPDGSPGALDDIGVGDRLRVLGYVSPAGVLVAEHITITHQEPPLATATPTEPAPTEEPTLTPTSTPWPTIAPSAPWRGEYYPNPFLSGEPALIRGDQLIDFQWGDDAPAATLPPDRFSIRWTGTWYFEEGVHRFYIQVDDGVRLYLDGTVVLDEWHDSAPVDYEVDSFLTEGQHEVMVEYYDGTASARIGLSWSYLGRYPDWKGEYYSNVWLDGDPKLVRNDTEIDFSWGPDSPAPEIRRDDFSVRWTRTLSLAADDYRFSVRCDDGVRLWVDNRLIIDAWSEGAKTDLVGDITLASGEHYLKVEYYEARGDAQISLGWHQIEEYAGWRGAYYDNPNLSGQPYFVRDDAAIAFEWSGVSPGSGLGADNFSVQWTRRVDFTGGDYVFHITSDDGARLWLDEQLILDQWVDGYMEELALEWSVSQGSHLVRLEYYQRGGDAVAHLWWERAP
jgi:hypothetical protein